MRIAVASGKGGTGKTLISTSLVRLWADQGLEVTYVDADAEEPNGHLFLKPEVNDKRRFKTWVPAFKAPSCAGHGKCQEICAFNAILSAKGRIIVFDELCHGCGACLLACPDHALVEKEREIGTIFIGKTGRARFFSGLLDLGEARVAPLIEEVVGLTADSEGIVVIDAPPGTSCSPIAAVRDADILLLVTEPTPFGMHDLQLAVGMGRRLGVELVSVLNRADLGDNRVREYLDKEKIPVLAEIPFDRQVAEAYSLAKLPLLECPSFGKKLADLAETLIATKGELP